MGAYLCDLLGDFPRHLRREGGKAFLHFLLLLGRCADLEFGHFTETGRDVLLRDGDIEPGAIQSHTELSPNGEDGVHDDLHTSDGNDSRSMRLTHAGKGRAISYFIAYWITINAGRDCSEQALDLFFGNRINGVGEATKVLDEVMDFILKLRDAIER